MERRRRLLTGAAVALLVGIGGAAGVFLFGPLVSPVCDTVTFPSSVLVETVHGHVDGPTASYCPVPSRGSWFAIAGFLVLALAAAVGLAVEGVAERRETRLPRHGRRTTMDR